MVQIQELEVFKFVFSLKLHVSPKKMYTFKVFMSCISIQNTNILNGITNYSLLYFFPPRILPVLRAAIRPTLRPAEVPRLTVDALPIC